MSKKKTFSLFSYKNIGKTPLVLIIDANPQAAVNVMKKIKFAKEFHMGNIFTCSPIKYQPTFEQKCKPFKECTTQFLQDTVLRQGTQFVNEISLTDQEIMSRLDEESKARYLSYIKPLHFLPHKIFGTSISQNLHTSINRFLEIPESYLFLHHPNVEDANFFKQVWMKRCMLELKNENAMLRVISVPTAKQLPTKFLTSWDFIFIFSRDPAELKDIYKRAKLDMEFNSLAAFAGTINSLQPKTGLVLHRREKQVEDEDGNTKSIYSIELWWTTSITRTTKNTSTI